MCHNNINARLAELVDALASGASGSNTVRVQISQRAPFFYLLNIHRVLKIRERSVPEILKPELDKLMRFPDPPVS